jgi:hypothetical protein
VKRERDKGTWRQGDKEKRRRGEESIKYKK